MSEAAPKKTCSRSGCIKKLRQQLATYQIQKAAQEIVLTPSRLDLRWPVHVPCRVVAEAWQGWPRLVANGTSLHELKLVFRRGPTEAKALPELWPRQVWVVGALYTGLANCDLTLRPGQANRPSWDWEKMFHLLLALTVFVVKATNHTDGDAAVTESPTTTDSQTTVPTTTTISHVSSSSRATDENAGGITEAPQTCADKNCSGHGTCSLDVDHFPVCNCFVPWRGGDCQDWGDVRQEQELDGFYWPYVWIMIGVCFGLICLERLYSSCRTVYLKRQGLHGFQRVSRTDGIVAGIPQSDAEHWEHRQAGTVVELPSLDE
eukprot:g65665.t1